MFDVINLIFAAGVAVSGINLYSSADTRIADTRESVQAVTFHREFYRSDSHCEFRGVMVPFVRDWDIVRSNAESGVEAVQKAEPDETAGQAFLINEKICDGQSQALMRGDDLWRLREGGTLYRKKSITATDLLTTAKDQQPKWLIQVLDRLARLAPNDPVAAKFLATSKEEIAQLRGVAGGSTLPLQANN